VIAVVVFYDIHRKEEALFFCSVPDITREIIIVIANNDGFFTLILSVAHTSDGLYTAFCLILCLELFHVGNDSEELDDPAFVEVRQRSQRSIIG
jgi:hypothetical protein